MSRQRDCHWSSVTTAMAHQLLLTLTGIDGVGGPVLVGRVVTDGLGGDSVGEVVEQSGSVEADADLELAHVDALALAGHSPSFDRGEDGDGAVQAGHVIVVAKADADVVASGHTGEIGQAGECVERWVRR